jgi:hypothetical protein
VQRCEGLDKSYSQGGRDTHLVSELETGNYYRLTLSPYPRFIAAASLMIRASAKEGRVSNGSQCHSEANPDLRCQRMLLRRRVHTSITQNSPRNVSQGGTMRRIIGRSNQLPLCNDDKKSNVVICLISSTP